MCQRNLSNIYTFATVIISSQIYCWPNVKKNRAGCPYLLGQIVFSKMALESLCVSRIQLQWERLKEHVRGEEGEEGGVLFLPCAAKQRPFFGVFLLLLL
jgi:hypothetical protein